MATVIIYNNGELIDDSDGMNHARKDFKQVLYLQIIDLKRAEETCQHFITIIVDVSTFLT